MRERTKGIRNIGDGRHRLDVILDEVDEYVGNVVAHPGVAGGAEVHAVGPVLLLLCGREGVVRDDSMEIEGIARGWLLVAARTIYIYIYTHNPSIR